MVDVSSQATSGDGSKLNPWLGWDTAITWQEETQYEFPSGIYQYSISPNFLKTGIALVGEAGTILKFIGPGNAVCFDNPGGQSPNYKNWTMNVRMENFIVCGTAIATNGLFLRGVRNGYFKHISVRDVSGAGLWTEACVTNILENFRVTKYECQNYQFNAIPAYGIVFASRGGDWSTTWTVINPVIEGVSVAGFCTKFNCYANNFIGGTSESNLGKGATIQSVLNTFIGTDFEQNGGNDIELSQSRNILINVTSDKKLVITQGQSNRIISGQFHDISIPNIADFTSLEGVLYSGTLTDGSQDTIKIGNQGTLDGGLRFDSYLNHVVERMPQLPSSSVVNTDASRFSQFYTVVFQDFLLANPTNGINGQAVTWRIEQDNTGGRLISYGSKFRVKNGASFPVLSTAPLAFDYITAIYNSARDTWDIQ